MLSGHPRRVYLSFPSINAGETRFHPAEVIGFAQSDALFLPMFEQLAAAGRLQDGELFFGAWTVAEDLTAG